MKETTRNTVIVKWAKTRGVLQICFCFKCRVPSGPEFFQYSGHRTQEATFAHTPTAEDPRWLVSTDRQAGGVRDALSPRTRGVRWGLSGRARRGVRESKMEVKRKKGIPRAHPRRGLGDRVTLRLLGARQVSRRKRENNKGSLTDHLLRPDSVILITPVSASPQVGTGHFGS